MLVLGMENGDMHVSVTAEGKRAESNGRNTVFTLCFSAVQYKNKKNYVTRCLAKLSTIRPLNKVFISKQQQLSRTQLQEFQR